MLDKKSRRNSNRQQRQIKAFNSLKTSDSPTSEGDNVPQRKTAGSVEVQFAQKLAANDAVIRDRAVKKLRTWLSSRVGCAASCALFGQDEMLRLWKGLYYCFWMSDKPLVQEELADNISRLINCFKKDLGTGVLFFRCFLMTMGREWFGLDRLRTDKFMMLTRRMLRQAFVYIFQLYKDCEELGVLQSLVAAYDECVVAGNRKEFNAALGFQLHFVDIFMEELSKMNPLFEDESTDNCFITDDIMEVLVKPFVDELIQGKEKRFLDQIEERIFNHLIRQSDVAIAYDNDGESDQDDGHEPDLPSGDGKGFSLKDSDPRAGVGDVTLSSLDTDGNKMAEILFKAGSEKGVPKAKRDRLYRMTKRFQMLAKGIYPFAMELKRNGELDQDIVVGNDNGFESINIERIARKSTNESSKEMEKVRRAKFEHRKAMKEKIKEQRRRLTTEQKAEAAISTEPKKGSKKKRGKERAQERINCFVEKNRLSEESVVPDSAAPEVAENVEESQLPKKKKQINATHEEGEWQNHQSTTNEEVDENEVNGSTGQQESPGSTRSNKKRKKLKRKSEEVGDQNEKEMKKSKHDQLLVSASKAKKPDGQKGKKKKKELVCPIIRTPDALPPTTFLRKALSKSVQKSLKGKKFLSASEPPKAKTEPRMAAGASGGKCRKLNFAMSKNKYQSLKDIDQSIQESPDIPFDADKRPRQGVLKVSSARSTPTGLKGSKPKNVLYNTMINAQSKFAAKRAIASDFF